RANPSSAAAHKGLIYAPRARVLLRSGTRGDGALVHGELGSRLGRGCKASAAHGWFNGHGARRAELGCSSATDAQSDASWETTPSTRNKNVSVGESGRAT